MKRWLVGVWAVLLLLPALPVCAFYLLFSDQNYFELENAARGVAAAGPIAAYFALVWLGWRLYRNVSSLIAPLSPLEERLTGTSWKFSADSYHGTQRFGSFKIGRDDRDRLHLAGTFEDEAGKSLGSWDSTMTFVGDGRLQVVYVLDSVSDGDLSHSTGMLLLNPTADDFKRLKGNWVVMGRDDANGSLDCWRE